MSGKRYKKKSSGRLSGIAAIAVLLIIVAAVSAAITFGVKVAKNKKADNTSSSASSDSSSKTSSAENVSSDESSSEETGPNGLDVNYSVLLLVNAQNPLPEDYDYEGNLTTIPTKYINGSLNQIDKDVWPYMQAMLDAAWAEGVQLYVRSPYRSYATQKMLFQNQVERCLKKGLSQSEAEAEAATVVTRPGTSEHNTGFSADFNIAEDSFESTPMFTWMQQHAADYGFVLRFPKDKQDKTGIVYESWHYRFVGIKTAKEMNKLNMCLEEYTEYIKTKKK